MGHEQRGVRFDPDNSLSFSRTSAFSHNLTVRRQTVCQLCAVVFFLEVPRLTPNVVFRFTRRWCVRSFFFLLLFLSVVNFPLLTRTHLLLPECRVSLFDGSSRQVFVSAWEPPEMLKCRLPLWWSLTKELSNVSSSSPSSARLVSFPDSQVEGVFFKVFSVRILVFPMMFCSCVEQWESGNRCGRNVWTDRGPCVWINVGCDQRWLGVHSFHRFEEYFPWIYSIHFSD